MSHLGRSWIQHDFALGAGGSQAIEGLQKIFEANGACVRLGDVEFDRSERVSAADATAFDRNEYLPSSKWGVVDILNGEGVPGSWCTGALIVFFSYVVQALARGHLAVKLSRTLAV